MFQKWEGDCDLWDLNEIIKKIYTESLKKIVGAVWESDADAVWVWCSYRNFFTLCLCTLLNFSIIKPFLHNIFELEFDGNLVFLNDCLDGTSNHRHQNAITIHMLLRINCCNLKSTFDYITSITNLLLTGKTQLIRNCPKNQLNDPI